MNMIAKIAAAPVVLAGMPAAAASLTCSGESTSRAAWDQKQREFAALQAEKRAFDPQWTAAYERYKATRPDMAKVIDWKTLGIFSMHRDRTARVLDVEAAWQQYLAGEGKWWWAPEPEAAKARYRAALDSVLEFRRLEAAAKERSGLDKADDLAEQFCDRLAEMEGEILTTPAPDHQALLWKLERLFEGDGRDPDGYSASWCPEWVNAFMADAHRLLAAGSA